MSVDIGRGFGQPASLGKRIAARLLTGFVVTIPAMVMQASMISRLDGSSPGAGGTILFFGSMIVALGVSIWSLVLIFTESTTIGGKVLGVKYLLADSGEDATAKLFLKYLVQGLFESFTLGLGAISYLFTFRDGQHWIDRIMGVVGVEKASIGAAPAARPQQSQATMAPAVMPVSMPQAPRSQNQPAQHPANPWAAQGAPVAFAAGPDTTAPPSTPGFGVPQGAMPSPGPSPRPAESRPTPFAPSNPWARPQEESLAATASPFGAPPLASPAPTSLTPSFGATHGGAPTGPSPFSGPPAPFAVPPVGAGASSSLMDDHTEVDADDDDAPVVLLDDGQEIKIEGPVVLGRNPSAPAAYPQARPVQLVDESMRMSKSHAVLVPFGAGVGVYDVGATNGVSFSVDGNRIKLAARQVHELPPGAELYVGGRSLRVRQ